MDDEEVDEELEFTEFKLPATPCSAFPGTPRKISVMMRRASLGYLLFHPDDARRQLDDER